MALGLVIFFCVGLTGCLAYPNGDVTSACVDMFPTGHGADAQTSTAPYTITVNTTSYGSDVLLTLTALDGGYFEGVFIQARRAVCDSSHDTALGTYMMPDTDSQGRLKLLDCSGAGNALVHKDKEKKRVLQAIWVPPAQSEGSVYFRGTFVKETEEFWTTVSSEFLSYPQQSADSPKKCDVRTKLKSGASFVTPLNIMTSLCLIFSAYFLSSAM